MNIIKTRTFFQAASKVIESRYKYEMSSLVSTYGVLGWRGIAGSQGVEEEVWQPFSRTSTTPTTTSLRSTLPELTVVNLGTIRPQTTKTQHSGMETVTIEFDELLRDYTGTIARALKLTNDGFICHMDPYTTNWIFTRPKQSKQYQELGAF